MCCIHCDPTLQSMYKFVREHPKCSLTEVSVGVYGVGPGRLFRPTFRRQIQTLIGAGLIRLSVAGNRRELEAIN